MRAANPSLNPNLLQPEMQIAIPNIAKYVSSLSYYVLRSPYRDRMLINDFAPYSTYISIFDYQFASNGDIINDLNDLVAIEETWKK